MKILVVTFECFNSQAGRREPSCVKGETRLEALDLFVWDDMRFWSNFGDLILMNTMVGDIWVFQQPSCVKGETWLKAVVEPQSCSHPSSLVIVLLLSTLFIEHCTKVHIAYDTLHIAQCILQCANCLLHISMQIVQIVFCTFHILFLLLLLPAGHHAAAAAP